MLVAVSPVDTRTPRLLGFRVSTGTRLGRVLTQAGRSGDGSARRRSRAVARGVRRSSGPLDARAQAILRAVIDEYVTTAVPVGSQTLVERYPFGVSSATVRNVLAELELEGYLGHPHTSAGRVPTDVGYRFYVESLDRGDAAPADRAAHDPPPVRAGGVRHRPVVPPGGHDARLRDALGRAWRRRPSRAPRASGGSSWSGSASGWRAWSSSSTRGR